MNTPSVKAGRFEPLVVELTEHRPVAWLLVLAGSIFLPWLTAETVYTTLEGLRLVPAREMLATGDWVVPRLSGDPYLAKPPLVYWVIAGLSVPSGEVSAFTGRLASVLSMLGTMLLVLWFGRRHLGPRPAFLAALTTGLSLLSFEKATRAELEALLLFSSTLGLLMLFEACQASRGRLAFAGLAALGLGAAVLTKGPVPLLAFATCGIALLATAPRLRTATTISIVAIGALVVCLPWVAALGLHFGEEELRRVLEVELLKRVEGADAINEEGPFYYPVALVRGLAPWSLLLPGLFALRLGGERGLMPMLASWAGGTLLLLSVSSGKEVRYLLPTYPAWALLLAWGWCARERLPWLAAYGRALLALLLAGTWLLPLALAAVVWREGREAVGIGLALCAVLLAGRALLGWGAKRPQLAAALAGLVIMCVAARGLWAEVYWPRRAPGYPYPEVGAGVADHVPPGETLLALGRVSASLQFYVDRPLHRVSNESRLARCRSDGSCSERWLLTDREIGEGAQELGQWQAKRHTYRLYELDTPD